MGTDRNRMGARLLDRAFGTLGGLGYLGTARLFGGLREFEEKMAKKCRSVPE